MKNIILYPVSVLIFFFTKIILNIFNYKLKFAFVYSSRLGHLCRALDIISKNKKIYFIINHQKKIANNYLLNNLKKKDNVFHLSGTEKLISLLNRYRITKNLVINFHNTESYFHKFLITSPSVIFSKRDELYFYNLRKKKNLIGNFVNFHNRDSMYLEKININDNNYHGFRDFEFKDYSKAIDYLLKKHPVIRTGSNHKKFLKKDKNFYDFTNKNYNEKELVCFYKYSKYNVMSFDGVTVLASLFRKKQLYVNLVPFNLDIISNLNPGSIFIPKKIFSKKLNRCLTFSEMDNLGLNVHTAKEIFKENDFKMLNNSPTEILDAVKEMEKIYDQVNSFSKMENDIIDHFWNSLNKQSYQKANFYRKKLKLKISPKFLSNNLEMINS